MCIKYDIRKIAFVFRFQISLIGFFMASWTFYALRYKIINIWRDKKGTWQIHFKVLSINVYWIVSTLIIFVLEFSMLSIFDIKMESKKHINRIWIQEILTVCGRINCSWRWMKVHNAFSFKHIWTLWDGKYSCKTWEVSGF